MQYVIHGLALQEELIHVCTDVQGALRKLFSANEAWWALPMFIFLVNGILPAMQLAFGGWASLVSGSVGALLTLWLAMPHQVCSPSNF